MERESTGRTVGMLHVGLAIAAAIFSLTSAWLGLEFRANLAELKLSILQVIESQEKENTKIFATRQELDRLEGRVNRMEADR